MTRRAEVNGQTIAYDVTGSGPPLLLLHGFPQTKALWTQVVPHLTPHFTTVTADLRGYGASSKPSGVAAYSFRQMAADQYALMRHLGFERFHLAGHDRGARTAHRLAKDYGGAVQSLCVMDIVPTQHLLEALTWQVAKSYYHWFFLAQPAPGPEKMIASDPDAFFESCLTGWGRSDLSDFDPAALSAYRQAWREPACIEAMCNDYRAALEIDFALDARDLHVQLSCPALVLYGQDGVVGRSYDVAATWAPQLAKMQVQALPGGHFFVDQAPQATAEALLTFLMSLR